MSSKFANHTSSWDTVSSGVFAWCIRPASGHLPGEVVGQCGPLFPESRQAMSLSPVTGLTMNTRDEMFLLDCRDPARDRRRSEDGQSE